MSKETLRELEEGDVIRDAAKVRWVVLGNYPNDNRLFARRERDGKQMNLDYVILHDARLLAR